jgi:hypothetical protein
MLMLFYADRLLDSLSLWVEAPLVKQAAGEVARECRLEVLDHIRARTWGMTSARVRGYIRAVAPQFVAAEVDAVLSWRRAGSHLRPYVIAEAIEQLIDLVVDDVRHARPRLAIRTRAA